MFTQNQIRILTRSCAWSCFAITVLIGSIAESQTITVTMCRDVIDVPSTATIADLPGPDGKVSMNEALIASDNTPGRQTIGFAIPESEWWLSDIYPGQVLLQSTFGWSAQEPVIIDGTTQTAFTGDTFPDGWEMSLDGLGLGLSGDDSELFGFHESHVGAGGNDSVFHDNTGSMRISIGPFNSGCVVRDNEAWMIELTYSDDNVVIRNVTERVRITGQGNFGPPAGGNRIGGPDPADRNFITGFGNYGEHGTPNGDCIEMFYTNDTLIQNNYIGTTPDGMAISNPACTSGIAIQNSNDNVFIRDNLIAIQAFGVFPVDGVPFGQAMYLDLYEGGTGIEVTGNTFGLNALGEPVLGSVNGIVVNRYVFEFDSRVHIGGPNPGEGNVIAGHLEAGVLMMYGSTGFPQFGTVRLSGNSIFGNGEIGIDLTPNTWTFGHTANDTMDIDDGANGLQNFPVILAASNDGQAIQVAGQLNSEALSDYTLEFFASPECDPSGFGQGQIFLGSTSVVTDANGNADFDESFAATIPAGWVITSTATLEPVGATSEFSACAPIQTEWFTAESYTIARGTYVSGTVADLEESDNADLSARRNSADTAARVFLEVKGVCPTATPSTLKFVLEGSVFARSQIIQSIDLYNYDTDSWEEIGSSTASRFVDSTTISEATGDLSRFVQPGTNSVDARCRFESPIPRQTFAINVDQTVWTFAN